MRVGRDFKYILEGHMTADSLRQILKNSNGYCPCDIVPTKKCMCDDMKKAPIGTICFCGIFKKVGVVR